MNTRDQTHRDTCMHTLQIILIPEPNNSTPIRLLSISLHFRPMLRIFNSSSIPCLPIPTTATTLPHLFLLLLHSLSLPSPFIHLPNLLPRLALPNRLPQINIRKILKHRDRGITINRRLGAFFLSLLRAYICIWLGIIVSKTAAVRGVHHVVLVLCE